MKLKYKCKVARSKVHSKQIPFVVKDTECDVFVRRPGTEPYDATSLDIAVAFKSDVVSYSVCRKFGQENKMWIKDFNYVT